MGIDDLGIAGLAQAELIGTGGFAVVYRAEQPAFRRTVAVKLLMAGRLDEATSHRFERECQLMGSLSEHPSIVTMFDAGFTAEGRPYLLMAYMPGGSLEDRIAASGPMPWREAVPICVRMAGALEVAHRSGVVHRDVKPDNILLSSFGEPQLTDFGIARIAGGPETRSGIITASMAHAAPEVIDGRRPGVAADVYSLGSTLYALLAGEPAFAKKTDESLFPMLDRVRTAPVPDLRPRGVPAAVAAVVEAAMEKDPADRPHTAQQLGEMLQDAERRGGLAPTSMLLGFDTQPPAELADTVVTDLGETSPRSDGSAASATDTEAPAPIVSDSPAEPGDAEPAEVASVAADSGDTDRTVIVPGSSAEPAEPEPAPAEPPLQTGGGRRWWPVAVLGAVAALVAIVGGIAVFSGGGDRGSDTGAVGNGQPVVDLGHLDPGREARGTLDVDEVHLYRFDVPEGIVVSVEMRAPDPNTDSFVQVVGPDGALAAADDDLAGGEGGLDAQALFVTPADGTYTIEASNRTGDRAEYVLTVFFEAAPLLRPPVLIEGELGFSPDEHDLFVVTARAGEVIDVLLASEQPGLDPYLVVYGPAEELAGDDDSGGGIEGLDARVQVPAPVDGSYRIKVGHNDRTGGRYRLEVLGPAAG